MAKLQSNFIKFHDAIKLEMEDKNILIEKRKEVEEAIITGISEFKISFFNQGSCYSTYTGILPLDEGDYDIDRGAIASFTREEYSPKKAKEILYNALAYTFGEENVKVKQPCVTVKFSDDVHVDVALYCSEDENIFLARGKLSSLDENTLWEESDPKELTKQINEAMNNADDRAQYRRVIRYLKRWKDLNFKKQENRPTGIGISVFALKYFNSSKQTDHVSFNFEYNDALALQNFVSTMISNFKYIYDIEKDKNYQRLEVTLPVKPHSDVYAKVSNNQMQDFHDKLVVLKNAVKEAIETSDLHEATKILNKQFGEDFEVVSQEETANKFSTKAIISDHPSA
ncbi:MAG: hypothetical protein LBV67_00045 [Streptococcaceae bacterium]|jgi:hypothetical protein|nr:hypothetical protein [Streptococcaceae bacterium]